MGKKRTDLNIENTINKWLRDKWLRDAPPKIKKWYPPILQAHPPRYKILKTNKYFLLVFLTDSERERIDYMISRRYDPFPGLLTEDPSSPAIIKFENSRNVAFTGCSVSNMYSFSYGKDSTAMIQNHKQSIVLPEFGNYSYEIPLAYLITLGDEIHENNLTKFLKEILPIL
jgi:hypothetical protein